MILWQDTTYHKAIALQKAHLLKQRDGVVYYGHGFMMYFNSTPPENDTWQYVTEFEVESCWWAYVWMMRAC